MDQGMTRLVLVDFGIAALVKSLYAIRHVARRAAGAAEVAAPLVTGDARVAALALLAGIGPASQVRMFGDLLDIDLWNLLQPARHLVWVQFGEGRHIRLVGIGADCRCGAVVILDIIIAPVHLVSQLFLQAPGPEVALQLAGLGRHQRLLQALGVTLVA